MKYNLMKLTLVAAMVGISQLALSAAILTPAITSPGGTDVSSYGGSIGYEFSLGSDGVLNTLGLYDTGTAFTSEVGIFNTTGTLLAEADVTTLGTTLDTGKFDYSAVITNASGVPETLTLTAGTDYIIGAAGTSYIGDVYPSTVSPGVTLIASKYSSSGSGGFQFPDATDHQGPSTDTGLAYVGPNFEFSTPTTPEPASFALLGAGLLALVLIQRSRSRAA